RISQSRSTLDPDLVYEIDGWELKLGDFCPKGSQLRPNIVWFGEPVPMIETASDICRKADFFAVVGTSLAVYPAAGLIHEIPPESVNFAIDPDIPPLASAQSWTTYAESASTGVSKMRDMILSLLP